MSAATSVGFQTDVQVNPGADADRRNADFLSSIEILIVDQLNALSMQNWEHLQVSHVAKTLFHYR